MLPQFVRLQRPPCSVALSERRKQGRFLVTRTRTIPCASGRDAEVIKAQIASLQQEAADAESQARDTIQKISDLQDVVRDLENLALKCLDRQANDKAREIMREKQGVEMRLEAAKEKVQDLVALEVKLSDAIDTKRSGLLAADLAAGVEYKDDNSGVRIKIGEDGKPTFERTGVVNQTPTPPAPDNPTRDPWFANRDAAVPAPPPEPQQRPQYNEFSFRRREQEERPLTETTGYVPTVDELLREGDRRLDDQFLELERRQLEKSLRASPSATQGSSNLDAVPSPPAAREADAEERREEERRAEHARAGSDRVTVAEWVTMGQNSLMDGALAGLADRFEPQYDDAARALVAVTNARIRGEDPSPAKLLSLITATLRPPSGHDSGIFWGVSRADGAGQLSGNIKIAIFGAALQLTIEDLLSGASKFLPDDAVQRSVEARALLVALAAAVDLRSANASDFAVKMLCRAIRTCLINALGSLRQTMSTEDRASLDRAEADLKALHHLLGALPIALPLAMGHAAALEATEQLRGVMSPVDAQRLDKLYRLVCGDDGSSTILRVILGPLMNELD
eukprot:jgi/Ulvmu1/71/UM001_0074.1